MNTATNYLDKTAHNYNRCAIIALKPTEKIFAKLIDISEDLIDLEENQVKSFLNQNLLDKHTVPVCTPLLKTPDNLGSFIKSNSKILFDLMLTSFPFPIAQWHFTNKNIELLFKFVDIKYFPFVCKAITNPVKSTLDLAVTFALPTNHLTDYIAENIATKKMSRSKTEMTVLEFILTTGIAIVTNGLEPSKNQNPAEYVPLLNDSKNFLTPFKDEIIKRLFYFYFKNEEEFPEESSYAYLNKWFKTNTYQGMYTLTEESAQKYA